MTKLEREQPEMINASRKKRIAKGSGTTVQEINRLLKQFEDMKKMMKTMSGMQKGKKKGPSLLPRGLAVALRGGVGLAEGPAEKLCC